MKKFIYGVILVAVFFAPVERVEISKLLPINAIAAYVDDGNLVLETDTGVKGKGINVIDALKDLEKNALKIVYLDTAEYLLVSSEAEVYLGELKKAMKKTVEVYICNATDRVKEVVEYLCVSGEITEMRRWWTK